MGSADYSHLERLPAGLLHPPCSFPLRPRLQLWSPVPWNPWLERLWLQAWPGALKPFPLVGGAICRAVQDKLWERAYFQAGGSRGLQGHLPRSSASRPRVPLCPVLGEGRQSGCCICGKGVASLILSRCGGSVPCLDSFPLSLGSSLGPSGHSLRGRIAYLQPPCYRTPGPSPCLLILGSRAFILPASQ